MSIHDERVAAGAHLLDVQRPMWYNRVDLDNLAMSSTEQCILGQVFNQEREGYSSGYSTGMRMLFGENWQGHESIGHGFAADGGHDYDMVSNAWVREVLNRRDPEPLAPWERELLNGNTHTQSQVDDAREDGVRQGRADGILFYRSAIDTVNVATANAGLNLDASQILALADALIDIGATFSE